MPVSLLAGLSSFGPVRAAGTSRDQADAGRYRTLFPQLHDNRPVPVAPDEGLQKPGATRGNPLPAEPPGARPKCERTVA